jgi:hypothetical protein
MLIKLKANIPEIFLGVFLTVAVFAVGMAVESSRSPSASGGSLPATDKTTDWLLVLLNLFLVGSTLLLWKANNRSAKIAERALTELEAPFIVIKISANGIHWGPARSIMNEPLKFRFANYGRTPAYIFEFIAQVVPVDVGGGGPIVIDPTKERGHPMPYGVIASPTEPSQEFENSTTGINFFEGPDSASWLAPVTKRVYFRGFVRYGDIFQNQYMLGFCFEFRTNSNTWILRGGKNHNYCKKTAFSEIPEWMQPSGDPNTVRSSLNRAVLNQKDNTLS